MLTLIKLINIYLPIKYKRFFLFTFFLLLFCGFAEIISLGSLIPFLSLLEGNDLFSSNYKFIYNLFPEEIYNNYQFYIAAFIFGLSSIFSSFLRLTSLWANSLLASKVGSYWSDLMFSGTLSKDYEYHINQNSSKLIVSLTQHLNSTVRAIFFLFQFITGILITIFIISFLLFIDPKISSIAFLIFGTYYALIATFFKKKLKNNSKIIADINQKQVRIVRESIGGIRDIILDNNKKFYEEKYKINDKKMRIKQAINELITAFPRYSLEGIALVTISFLGVFFYLQSKSNGIAILGGIAFGAQKLLPSLQTIYGSWARIKNYNSDILEVENALKNLKKSIIIKPKEINTKFENFKVISLLNISYKYKNSSKYCLKNVSLQIEKGQFIGFIGKTGSGKSTLVDLLMGLLKPSGGEIYIDKKLINNKYQDYYSNLLQRCISHVPQEVFLRNESILSNIVNSQYSKKDLNLALKVSKVKDFVSKLDDGLETIVGERGIKLSGGQKQRIGIARALIRNKQILVLDESTSALDEITEKNILDNIKNYYPNLTILMISHRTSNLAYCDKVFKVFRNKVIKL